MSDTLFTPTAVKGEFTVIEDGTDLGHYLKVEKDYFVKPAGAADYTEESFRSRGKAVQALRDALPVEEAPDVEPVVAAIEVEELSEEELAETPAVLEPDVAQADDEVVPMSAEEAAAKLQGLLADVQDEPAAAGGEEGPESAGDPLDEPEEPKELKHPRATCPICQRRVPAKADGSVASHKGFKRTMPDGSPARRCDGTATGIKGYAQEVAVA